MLISLKMDDDDKLYVFFSFLIEFVAMPTVGCYRKGNIFLS